MDNVKIDDRYSKESHSSSYIVTFKQTKQISFLFLKNVATTEVRFQKRQSSRKSRLSEDASNTPLAPCAKGTFNFKSTEHFILVTSPLTLRVPH